MATRATPLLSKPFVRQADVGARPYCVSVDYRVEGSAAGRVVANPRSYWGSEPVEQFDPALVIEV